MRFLKQRTVQGYNAHNPLIFMDLAVEPQSGLC